MFKFAKQLSKMKFIEAHNTDFRNEIIALYLESFSGGASKQYIDLEELNQYVDGFFSGGNVLIAIENNQLIGTLLYCPLKMDNLFPEMIQKNFNIEKCAYIAEIMVAEISRGQGIGTQLLQFFFETVDRKYFDDVFIRVWDKNTLALNLYKKTGFNSISSIHQTKRNPDKKGTFVMQKIYLHRKIV